MSCKNNKFDANDHLFKEVADFLLSHIFYAHLSLCWQEALHNREMEGVQSLRGGGGRGRGRGGRRPGHTTSCCSLDLFCYECRRKRQPQQSGATSLPTSTTASIIAGTPWHWHWSIRYYTHWPVTYAIHNYVVRYFLFLPRTSQCLRGLVGESFYRGMFWQRGVSRLKFFVCRKIFLWLSTIQN